jgi:hypothetical protein
MHEPEPPRRVEDRTGASLGTIFFGLILMVLGGMWLLDLAGVLDITWTVVGAVLLVLIGVALIAGAREGAHGGLIALGIFLAVILAIASLATLPSPGAGIGERTVTPTTLAEVEDEYDWAIGSQTLDLRQVDFDAGAYEIDLRLGMGELTVIVPQDVEFRVIWSVGAGEARFPERQHSGVGISGDYATPNFGNADVSIEFDVSVGMGQIEVRQ